MKYLTKEEYEKRLRLIKRENIQKQYKQSLKEAKSKWKTKQKAKKPKETSKKLAIYLFVLMNVIIVYCLVAMWVFADLSYLGVLITDIAAQILVYGIYCLKAYKAKKSSEDMKYKRDADGLNDLIEAGSKSGSDNSESEEQDNTITFNSMNGV